MSAFPKPCGRLDRHDEHDWTRPRLGLGHDVPARTYHCVGRVLVEGGYWADWDAEDDNREERACEDRISTELADRLRAGWTGDAA